MRKITCALIICANQLANADSLYRFSSDKYSSINNSTTCRTPAVCRRFTAEMSASGYFSLKESLGTNLTNKDIRDSLTSFSMTDGINEYSNRNSFISSFSVSTDSAGTITDTRIAIRKWQDNLATNVGGYLDELWLYPNAQAYNAVQCNNAESNLCLGAYIVESTSYVYPGAYVKWIADPSNPPPAKSPPFGGTIFINPDIITSNDKSTKTGLSYQGTASRLVYDRRYGWITLSPFLFDAYYDNGSIIEFQVNTEFGSKEEGELQASFYSHAIGQLPNVLRKDIKTVTIHKGNEPFGGGGNGILIHTGMSEYYIENGILEETLIHEACHTSMDKHHSNSIGWLSSQILDDNFISNYAKEFPLREDIAESFLPYLAIRYHAARIPPELESTIKNTMPYRISYFDSQDFDMYPIEYEEHRYALTVEINGFGSVTSNPEGINCGPACISRYQKEASVSLQPIPETGYSFGGWGGACSGTAPCTLTMDANKQVTASFTKIPASFSVNASVNGSGRITSAPQGIDCGTACNTLFGENTNVVLYASPNAGYSFSGWSGACGGTSQCSLTMNGDKQVTANFIQIPPNPYDPTKPFVKPNIPSTTAFVKRPFTIGWQLNMIRKNMPVRVKFAKDGGVFRVIKSTKANAAGVGAYRWKPTKAHRTANGQLQICAVPSRGMAEVCSPTTSITVQ